MRKFVIFVEIKLRMVATTAFDEIIDFLAGHNPERIINFHPSQKTQNRVEFLLETKRQENLTLEERNELEYYLMLEHIIRMAKAKALKSLA